MKNKINKLLLKNWTAFLDHKAIRSYCQTIIEQMSFPKVHANPPRPQMTISNIEISEKGLYLWVEICNKNLYTTSELNISFEGVIDHIKTIGVTYEHQ